MTGYANEVVKRDFILYAIQSRGVPIRPTLTKPYVNS